MILFLFFYLSFTLEQFNELLDHIKFDHGYTASSPPIVNVGALSVSFLNHFKY
jgi:hypothetical protein